MAISARCICILFQSCFSPFSRYFCVLLRLSL
nr:MAG TPA: hypothetical protein [Caudoviricetes sp.]